MFGENALEVIIDTRFKGDGMLGIERLEFYGRQPEARSRCDAVWYGDTIAYGCKDCGLSSASCVCVSCFELSDHDGHDFYISRSDYGCCDCGDPFAWRKSGFCSNHKGPRTGFDARKLIVPRSFREKIEELIR